MTKKESILIIDDEVVFSKLLAKRFLHKGYTVYTANSAEKGFALALEKKPSIITTDINMPKQDGFELCQNIRSKNRTKHIPVVIISGNDNHAYKVKGFELGADDYVSKPFNPQELEARVLSLLRRRHK